MGLRIGISGLGRCGVNWLVALTGMVGGIAGQARNDVSETLNNL